MHIQGHFRAAGVTLKPSPTLRMYIGAILWPWGGVGLFEGCVAHRGRLVLRLGHPVYHFVIHFSVVVMGVHPTHGMLYVLFGRILAVSAPTS